MKKINADWYSKGKLDRKTWRPTDEKNKFLYSKGFYPTKIKEEDLSKDYIKIRSRTIWYMTGFVKTSGVKDLYYTYLKENHLFKDDYLYISYYKKIEKIKGKYGNDEVRYFDFFICGGDIIKVLFAIEKNSDIDTTEIRNKTILSKTNNKYKIIEQLENTIKYEKDGYIGEYILNPNTLKIKTNYNGFREDLIEETINYTNLEKNDLDFIPKQTIKNGLTLDLLNVEWESTKMIGEYEVANTYTAKCYYATKQRVDYPNTYTVTAEYFGTATKTEEHPITYVVKYEKEEPEVVEEKQDNNVLPVVGGTTGIILVIVLFLTRNVTVYNYKDGEYKKVGKVRATKAGKIKLDRFSLFETTNKYKLELSKNLTKKLKGKMITVSKNGTTIKMLVKENEKEKYIVEVRI